MAKKCPIIATLNMKGGVGKTTLTANLGYGFFQRKNLKVLLVDLDSQANLTQALLTRAYYEKLVREDRTLKSVMEAQVSVMNVTQKTAAKNIPSVTEIADRRSWMTMNPSIRIDLVSGHFELVKFALVAGGPALGVAKNRFFSFLDEAQGVYDMVFLDCNPSASFFTMCALERCSDLLVPVRPDRYSVLGLELLHSLVSQDLASINPKPKFHVVLNGVNKNSGVSDIERDLRAHPVFGLATLASRVYHSKLLYADPSYAGFAVRKKSSWKNTLRDDLNKVVDELAGILKV